LGVIPNTFNPPTDIWNINDETPFASGLFYINKNNPRKK
jgi:hypothetical protein